MKTAQHIPLADLSAQYRSLQDEIDTATRRVWESGRFVNGPELEAFENEFAAFVGARHAVGVGNGTDALALALQGAGLRPGDEVIVPAHTFHATVEAVYLAGLTPRLADVNRDTLCLDGEGVGQALSGRTRAVLPVHLYGYPAALREIIEIAAAEGLVVIEDAAQAHGSRLDGRHLGTWGAAGAFSFFPGKTLGAYGDGGMIVTDDAPLAEKARRLGNHGRPGQEGEIGRNSRLDEVQAAILRVKLRHLEAWAARRRGIDARYRARVPEREDFGYLPRVEGSQPGPLNTVVRTSLRDELSAFLTARDIDSKPHYPQPVHQLPAFRHLAAGSAGFPHAEEAARTVLSLPNYPEMTEAQVARVAEALAEFVDARCGSSPTKA